MQLIDNHCFTPYCKFWAHDLTNFGKKLFNHNGEKAKQNTIFVPAIHHINMISYDQRGI